MKHLNITKVEELLKNDREPRLIEPSIIDYIEMLRNPPHSLHYSPLNAYLAAILAFYSMNDVALNKKKIGKYLGEQVTLHKDRAYTTEGHQFKVGS